MNISHSTPKKDNMNMGLQSQKNNTRSNISHSKLGANMEKKSRKAMEMKSQKNMKKKSQKAMEMKIIKNHMMNLNMALIILMNLNTFLYR